jgi:hypothetical protein
MGAHFHYTESQVSAIINGFLNTVNCDSSTRFFRRLSDRTKFKNVIEEALKDPRNKDRFKIVDWLEVNPASVHHGGANSYYEAAL